MSKAQLCTIIVFPITFHLSKFCMQYKVCYWQDTSWDYQDISSGYDEVQLHYYDFYICLTMQ